MIQEIADLLDRPDRDKALYDYAKRRREAGEPWDVVYADFDVARQDLAHDEAAQDDVMDVMDCLWGWCKAEYSLRN